MPRNPPPRQPQGPTLSPEQARIQLENSVKRANGLSKEQPLTEERYRVWQTNASDVLNAAFGEEHGHPHNFHGLPRMSFGKQPEHYLEAERRKRLARQIGFLEALIEEFTTVDAQTPSPSSDFFSDLDTDTRRVSEKLFNDGHYAESVSAAFKELNHQVKQEYLKRKGVEEDGADLMHKTFSPNNPVFVLADQSTESGRNTQQGFMELFAGSMIGIRNPHAHENLSLDPNGAKHFLYLASLSMKKFKSVR
jgi:uncharacterized protein (TIGR02391 family)